MLIACALAALGLDKIADVLFAANDAAHDAMTARRDEPAPEPNGNASVS